MTARAVLCAAVGVMLQQIPSHSVCDSVGSLAHTNRFRDRRMTRNYTVIIMQVFDLFSDQESVMLLLCCAKMCTVWNV